MRLARANRLQVAIRDVWMSGIVILRIGQSAGRGIEMNKHPLLDQIGKIADSISKLGENLLNTPQVPLSGEDWTVCYMRIHDLLMDAHTIENQLKRWYGQG